jgi:hypothetical protein
MDGGVGDGGDFGGGEEALARVPTETTPEASVEIARGIDQK